MTYEKYARELLECLVMNEQQGRIIQYNISEIAKGEIAVLMYLMDEKDGASAYEISQRFHINTSRVAAILNNLCRKGYVTRKTDDIDKRKIHVYITKQGRLFSTQRHHEVLSRVTIMLEKLGENDAKEYIRIMQRMLEIVKEIDKSEKC